MSYCRLIYLWKSHFPAISYLAVGQPAGFAFRCITKPKNSIYRRLDIHYDVAHISQEEYTL